MRSSTGRGFAAAAALLALLSACATSASRHCGATPDPAELGRLATTVDSTAAVLEQSIDSQSVALRQYLQSVVDRTAALDACGRITAPHDLRVAAQLGLSAGALGAETLERAYRWSRRAVVTDSSDRVSWRILAHAWDQLQLEKEQPQWFGTVVRCTRTSGARCALAPLDTTRVTDPERAELGLRTLVQQRAFIDSLNAARARP